MYVHIYLTHNSPMIFLRYPNPSKFIGHAPLHLVVLQEKPRSLQRPRDVRPQKLLQSVYNIIIFVSAYDGEQYPECLKQYIL